MNKDIVKQFFPQEIAHVELGECPFCHTKVNQEDFRDELSKREFEISGLCQKCQDETFKEE